MRTRRSPLLRAVRSGVFLLGVVGLVACDPDKPSSDAASGAASVPASVSVSVSAPVSASVPVSVPAPASVSADDELVPLQILRLTFTSNVRNKEPTDKLEAVKPGQRVWAHINARNRSGSSREIDLVFRVNGKERSRVPLDIQSSWSFRTWGYVTLRATDTSGDVTVTIIDDSGEEITSARIPIRP